MVPIFLVVAVTLAQATDARQYPGPERRVFEVRSRDAWPLVQARLKDLGLAVDKVDGKNQAVLTKWRRALGGGWLPEPQLPKGYVAERIRFVVFVSPFVERAHISVGSQAEATKMQTPRASALVYNVTSATPALMAEIDKAIAAAALPKFVPADPAPCSPSPQATITNPEKIPLSVFEVPYPGGDQKAGTGGTVVVEMTIPTDGAVSNLRVSGPPVGEQLEAAATGAASLLLYSPVRMGGCPVPFLMTYTVRFRR